MKITKYVLPVAGLGTRLLPATKSIPKEMLTVVDKPLIQYVVEEAVEAGAEQIILVTHASKRALEDHFDKNPELERALEQKGKAQLLQRVRSIIPPEVDVVAVRQPQALGLGHAVLCAASVVGDEPFGVILPDVLIHHSPGCMAQLVQAYESKAASIIGVEEVPLEAVDKYGIVSLQPGEQGTLQRMQGVVEKPTPQQAPSTLSVVGRYILTPAVLTLLRETGAGAGGEIQLTDAIATLIEQEPVYACTFEGKSYDCGDKAGFVRANLEYALRDTEIAGQVRQWMRASVEHG